MQDRFRSVYGRAGRPCPRCGERSIRAARAGRRQPHDILVPGVPALSARIGHKGADLIAPGNTLALASTPRSPHGVDMIEFDVLPEYHDGPDDGRLLLAHDYEHVAGAPTLEEGLAHLASAPFADVELDVDLKLPGYEERVVEALREHGLVERTLVSSHVHALRSCALRELEPELRLGWSVPRVQARLRARRRCTRCPGLRGCCSTCAGALPRGRARPHRGGALRRGDVALAPRHAARWSRRCASAGGELYVWTVDDAAAHPPARGARRHRRDHQRPAAVSVTSTAGPSRPAGRREAARSGRARTGGRNTASRAHAPRLRLGCHRRDDRAAGLGVRVAPASGGATRARAAVPRAGARPGRRGLPRRRARLRRALRRTGAACGAARGGRRRRPGRGALGGAPRRPHRRALRRALLRRATRRRRAASSSTCGGCARIAPPPRGHARRRRRRRAARATSTPRWRARGVTVPAGRARRSALGGLALGGGMGLAGRDSG